MIRRIILLCLGLWLIAAGGLSAHAGPCNMDRPQIEAAAKTSDHAHCDMTATGEPAAPAIADYPDTDANCCCPAVLVALPSPAVPDPVTFAFAQARDFPLQTRAASRTQLPEPRPPKA